MIRLSPEMQFISNILGSSLKPNDSHIELSHILGNIDWDEFIPLAARHGVDGLLFYWTNKLKLESSLPRNVYRSLRGIYESKLHSSEDYRKIIKKILMRCYESEIEIVLLKGAQLSHTDYPHFFLRPMGDIDLLIKGSNKLRIISLMLEMGFNLYHTGETCDKFFIRGISRREKENTHKPIFVEVHSNLHVPIRLNKSFSVDMAEFWNGTLMEYFNGFPFRQLDPTYNLIYLCTHLGEHHFSRLIWSYDIALLIHRHGERIDWERLEDHCRRMKVRSPIYHSLSLCQELFGISIPEKILKNLAPSWWRRKVGHFLIKRNLTMCKQTRTSRFSRFLIKVLSIDSWMEAMLWFLFPTKEWMEQQYSPKNTTEIYAYYLLHPILHLIKAMRPSMR
jgi:hypothetical protein